MFSLYGKTLLKLFMLSLESSEQFIAWETLCTRNDQLLQILIVSLIFQNRGMEKFCNKFYHDMNHYINVILPIIYLFVQGRHF